MLWSDGFGISSGGHATELMRVVKCAKWPMLRSLLMLLLPQCVFWALVASKQLWFLLFLQNVGIFFIALFSPHPQGPLLQSSEVPQEQSVFFPSRIPIAQQTELMAFSPAAPQSIPRPLKLLLAPCSSKPSATAAAASTSVTIPLGLKSSISPCH